MLGKTITRLRKKKGLTQADLAAQLQVHASHVTRWESGQVQPRSKTLDRLAEVLEVTVEELLAGDYSGVTATLSGVDDPELLQMFSQLHRLSEPERAVLKTFMGAILTRIQMEDMVHSGWSAPAAR